MIRETVCKLRYPSKSILEDVLSREGKATDKDYTPFDGLGKELFNQFKDSIDRPSVTDLRNYVLDSKSGYTDFDVTKAHDWVSVDGKTVYDRGKLNCKTLEDLARDAQNPELCVKKYIEYMCVGYKKNSASPQKKNKVPFTVFLENEEEESVEETDLLINEKYREDQGYLEKVIERLPYLIKAIWALSIEKQANLFSFIYAYMDIIGNGEYTSVSSVTEFRKYNLRRLKSTGEKDGYFVHENDNKYDIYKNAVKIFTQPSDFKYAWSLIRPFIDSFRLLDIDYRNEDAGVFNNTYVASIVCTYLPNSSEYVAEYGDLDAEVMLALKPENLFTISKHDIYGMYKDTDSTGLCATIDYERTATSILDILDMIAIESEPGSKMDELLNVDKSDDIIRIAKTLNAMGGIRNATYEFVEDVLYCNKEVFVIPGVFLCSFDGTSDYEMILYKCGIGVVVTSDYSNIPYLDFENLYNVVKSRSQGAKYVWDIHWGYLRV